MPAPRLSSGRGEQTSGGDRLIQSEDFGTPRSARRAARSGTRGGAEGVGGRHRLGPSCSAQGDRAARGMQLMIDGFGYRGPIGGGEFTITQEQAIIQG